MFWLAPVLIALGPRIARLLVPYAWFEDSAYIYHAFAFKSGLKPFLQTICVHPPTIERFLSLLYGIFGVSYRVAEIFSAIIISIAALLLFDICRQKFSDTIALIACALFSFSSLLARYHVYEREVFTLTISMAALWLIIKAERSWTEGADASWTGWCASLAGVLCGLGFGIKFSGMFIMPAIVAYLVLQKKYRLGMIVFGLFLLVGGAIWGYYLVSFGKTAFYQLVVFHFIKGTGMTIGERITKAFLPELNYLWFLGGGGIILSLFQINKPRAILAVPSLLFSEFTIFFLFIGSTIWPHNMIDLILPLSVGSAYAMSQIRDAVKSRHIDYLKAFVLLLFMILTTAFGAMDLSKNYVGWHGLSRKEVAGVCAYLRQNTPADMTIHAPQYIAIEAQRLKCVDYDELIGPYRWMTGVIEKDGLGGLRSSRQFSDWYDMVDRTAVLWRPELNQAILVQNISAAVWDAELPEWSMNYNIDVSLESLHKFYSNAGYAVGYRSGPYIVWVQND